jgi:hypothetical protein
MDMRARWTPAFAGVTGQRSDSIGPTVIPAKAGIQWRPQQWRGFGSGWPESGAPDMGPQVKPKGVNSLERDDIRFARILRWRSSFGIPVM